MKTVGTYEAKAQFSKLLECVEKGEEITITRRGKSIAKLVPADSDEKWDAEKVIEEIVEFRKGKTLGGLTVRELIEEGRRF